MKNIGIALGIAASACILAIPLCFIVSTSIYPKTQGRLVTFLENSDVPEILFIMGLAFWITKKWVDRIYRRIIRNDSHTRYEGFPVVLKKEKDNSEKRE
ncbi:MAG TPA: hypothetical protein VFE58_07420 [Tepidisphaeraceae bacterium]|nr:hypothetical protein [Tepidisphaeraceae bacterium]